MDRTSTNSKVIHADAEAVFKAFSERQALEYWLAPQGMTGKIHSFEFSEGGKYEMSLFYKDNQTKGKTAGNEDRFSATFTEIKPFERIVQTIHFKSDNGSFKDEMTMEVELSKIDAHSTKVTIIFRNIPTGIDPKDNEDGTEQSLQKLADYIEKTKRNPYGFGTLPLFSLLVACLFAACSTVRFQQYFPLTKNQVQHLLVTIDSTHQQFMDTLVCKEAIANKMPDGKKDRLWLSGRLYDTTTATVSLPVHYFEHLLPDTIGNAVMMDQSFAGMLYCFKNGELYVYEEWIKTMENDIVMQLLFPKRIKKHHSYAYQNGDHWKIFKYMGKESIRVNDANYKACIKISMYEIFGSRAQLGTVWFSKQKGLVKWEKKKETWPVQRKTKQIHWKG